MSPPLVKLYLFVVWPVVAAMLLPMIAAMFVALWIAIPFGVIRWEGDELKWVSPWAKS